MELLIESFKVFPNPVVDGNLTITVNNADSYKVINISGVSVQEGLITGKTTNIDLSDLATGSYIVEVKQGDKTIRESLIVK